MKLAYIASCLFSIAILAGCAPSKQEYAAIVTTVQGSAKARQFAMKECAANWTAQQRKDASIIIDSSEKDAPRLACARFVEAVRSGKLEYQDAVDFKRRRLTPRLIKIFQGR